MRVCLSVSTTAVCLASNTQVAKSVALCVYFVHLHALLLLLLPPAPTHKHLHTQRDTHILIYMYTPFANPTAVSCRFPFRFHSP